MRVDPSALPRPGPCDELDSLRQENAELKIRQQEMQDTLDAINAGDVDALVVNGDIYTLESAGATANRLRQDVLSQMQDAVFAFDTEGNIIFINAAAETRYGVRFSETIGISREHVFTESPAPDVGIPDSGVRDLGESPDARLSTHLLPNGESIFVETIRTVLNGANGEVLGSLAVVRDVTERIRAAALLSESEQRLRHINESLEAAVLARTQDLVAAQEALRQSQKMEAVGQLTGGIAHDFNNLLAGISSSLQALQNKVKGGRIDELERYTAMAQESLKRAAALTQRLLAFARRQTLDPKAVDVNQLVSDLIGLIERTVGPTIEIHVSSDADLWLTKIDGSQFENSLLNLCINARDAMPDGGGTLTVLSANTVVNATLAASFDIAPGDYVSVSVEDTGTGMPPEVIARAFDPFFTTKPVGQGTGLGLSMVYGFARQSGGHVRVLSKPGAGTTIEMLFPRHAGAVLTPVDELDAVTVSSGDGETILVVEDEETIRILMAEMLEEFGFKTLTAENGPAALRILQTGVRLDLIVSDVGLPGGMNGRQVADAARVLQPGLKVLFVTGYAENAAIRDGQLESGMEVITKPFEFTTLIAKVRDMTSRKS